MALNNQGRRTDDFSLAAGASYTIGATTIQGWISVFTEGGDFGSFFLNGSSGTISSTSSLNLGFLIGGILGNNIVSTSGGNFIIKNNTAGTLAYHIIYQIYTPQQFSQIKGSLDFSI